MKIQNPFASLTRFELILWLCSLAAVTASFVLSSDDYMTLAASLIGVTALIFVSKGYVLGQILTVVFAVFYGIISFYFRYYGEMLTYLGMTAPIAVMSVISWVRNPYEKSAEVKVGTMSRRTTVLMLALAAAVTAAFYFILRSLGTPNLIVSTISVTTSFCASYMTVMRSPYYALGYALNDVVLIVLWCAASASDISYLPMVICFVMFLLNDLYGLYHWHVMKNRQSGD